ncbi:MAG TPA: type II secretion system minor pseudopilin GspI [Moraxellaceae bacterium]
MPAKRRSFPRQSGFTLLEVLVALSVFAIAALALLNAQRTQISTDQRLEEKTFAHWVALNHLADLRLLRFFPEIGQSESTVKMAGREWLITTRIQGTPSLNVRLLVVSVAIKEGQQDMGEKPAPVTVVTGFLPRPPADSPASGNGGGNAP